uniref:Uncharacterized protein n=1 Tax=Culex tarsalis TaxID=7177 RepID=A0A1Q3G066_CULTA
MSEADLTCLVYQSIGTPDGIINCNNLNKLLLYLVRGIREIQEELGLGGDDGSSAEEGDGDLQESASGKSKGRWGEVYQTFKEHDDLLQCLSDKFSELEERLKKCCGEHADEIGEDGEVIPKPTIGELGDKVAEQEERMKEQEERLMESLAGLGEQMKASQEVTENRLNSLEELLAELQRQLAESEARAEEELRHIKSAMTEDKLQQIDDTVNQVVDLTQQLEALRAQLQELLQDREQMNAAINRLVQEKEEMGKSLAELAEDKAKMNKMVDKLAEQAGLKTRPESAGTTHRILTDVACIACEKDVVQRDRDDLPMALPGKGKPKKVIRKPRVDPLVRLRSKRAAGGAHTVVNADERVFRSAGQDICRCSTSSGGSQPRE